MKPVGHLLSTPQGLVGERGIGYDYFLGSNGLFIQAESPLIKATIPVAEALVRGLAPLEPQVELAHGKVPSALFDMAQVLMVANPDKENYFAMTWDGTSYRWAYPSQEGTGSQVRYQGVPNIVVDIHSHGRLGAFFSNSDDRDDQGFKISVVLGKVDGQTEYVARACVYGYFWPLELGQIFEGFNGL